MKYDNSRITMSENASTQTREETISNHSPPKQPEVGKLQADRQPFTVQASSRSDFPASTRREVKPMRKEACTNGVFDISEDTVIMMSNEEEKAEDKSKALPARNTSPLPRSKGEEGFNSNSTLTDSCLTFPGVNIGQAQHRDLTTLLLHGVETGVNVSFDKTKHPSLSHDEFEDFETEHRRRSSSFNEENGDVYEYDENVSSECTSSSDYNDICIFENPDFSQFGEAYQNLTSPNDRHLGSLETRCRSVSSLSPVKEESESDQSGEAAAESLTHRSGLNETYPVFEDIEGNLRQSCSSAESSRGYGKRLLCCSFSSDSGLGERSRESANVSMSDVSDASDCDSSTHGSDVSSASHTCQLHSLHEQTGRNEVFSRERPQSEGLDHRGSQKVFEGEGSQMEGRREGCREGLKGRGVLALTAERQVLEPLNIKARRRVTFSESVPSSDSHSGSSSPTPSSTSSGSFTTSFRPAFTRQDSVESTSSTSSAESILAVPLSPTSDASPSQPTAFLFPGRKKHCFSEPSEGSDLVLIVEGERFHVHSSVVAWQCHVLHVHLRQTGSHEVVLPNKRVEDLLSLLYLLYPFHRPTITDRNLEGLLDLAHTLGCERVKRMCTTYLMGLAQFRHLCPHRHLHHADNAEGNSGVDSTKGGHGVYNVNGHHQADHVKGHRLDDVKGRHPSDTSSGVHSSSSEDGASVTSTDAQFARMRTHDTQQLSSLCGCADNMAERAMDILQLAVRFELDEVYHTYLDVTARVRSDDLRACPRYGHLSAATREDILTSRVTRLENVVSNVSVRKSDLIGCGRSHHESHRLTFSGELCLRCISRNLLREAKGSV